MKPSTLRLTAIFLLPKTEKIIFGLFFRNEKDTHLGLWMENPLNIVRTSKADTDLQAMMAVHYSQPKGFVGRQIFYRIEHDAKLYGCIAFGSATKFLPGRKLSWPLSAGMNNIFYHVEKISGRYPLRNFTTKALLIAEPIAAADYEAKYGSVVRWLESLVEYPRTGDLYLKAGYTHVGDTKGYTCKRMAGTGTDSWTGKRVWDTKNLRPKRVFIKMLSGANE